MIHLTETIKAVELPENSLNVRIGSFGYKTTIEYSVKGEVWLNQYEKNYEFLGVIQNGEIPERLALKLVKKEYTQLGTMYLDDSGKRHSSPERALRQIFINIGIDLSKTVVIIKTK